MLDDIKAPFKRRGAKTNTENAEDLHVVVNSQPATPTSGGKWHSRPDAKKRLLIVGAAVFLVLAAGSAFLILREKPAKPVASTSTAKQTPPPTPTTVPARLSGVPVSPEEDKRPVRGFMIENSPDARPQSGLINAEVVYEAQAEGGITRFLALFQVNKPTYIGPVRSARPYYLDFLLPFDAPLGHAGGSPDALAQIKSLGVKDLDQFANSGSYMRVTSRFAPHNLYTDMNKIDELMAKKGFTTSNFKSFVRKAEAPSTTPTAKSIDLSISSFLYNAHYDYDAASNTYKRSEGGKPHTDEKSGVQIAPKVVVALVMNKGVAGDRLHSTYATIGSGHMYVFQDGTVTEGTWSKGDRTQQFGFTGADGKPLAFNPGQTWISIVDTTSKVAYKP